MAGRSTGWWRWALSLGSGWLRGIGPKQAILQRSTVKPADDRVHLLGVGRLDERESLGFLRFGIADYFNCVRDQVLGTQPALDIVGGNPDGEVSEKNSKAQLMLYSIGLSCGACKVEGTL